MREFIVEADGGSRGNPGPAGYGSVVLDAATGQTLAEAAEYIGIATNNVAEYRGLLAGLRAAHALDPTARVHVRMDSKLVVEQMSGRWKIKHPDMKPLALEAAAVLPPAQVTYEWIPRERNKHADRLANEAMDAGKRGEQWSAAASTAELDTLAEPSAPSSRREEAEPLEGEAARADADVRAARTVSSPGWSGAADMGAPATFVLLRHGETPLTPQKRFSGSGGTDPSLSGVGREQAERAAVSLARRGTIQHIVASPLARTRETAAAVAARLGIEVSVDEGLRETDFGAWEGLTFGEVRERYPDDLTKWLSDPEAEPTGGGESFAATATRIAATRDKLVAAYAGRTVLLVTHVTPIKTFVRLALGAPPESLFRMELSAASMSVVAYYADGNASVRLLNDTSHLRP
ncbi:bifunctional RNase H/acid phosphatase [Streptomyces lincolnensis]|uniref:Bifunctional RNase H/acid phosphatase n=1 Tax=Streptomyces lincolnensis TaxID=1915 RepID=A0A1B1M8T7_STRLN|nr:bifunctional RNase H/acid phosphatase [Streptomyces lincolnensis]ANS64857.1 bifunctional RNase H/acid phosphatase [Streptomyces lincolnensis]AXG56935.1 bifunctional RNase H/acid phosphatase [Streptomyces lincolnensis]QMV06659.1 bifunctional RNase H/acid phosphatase [Streptomyces lincolnensis]